jgi:CTP synthase (UTP-ammonia lyase)
MATNIGYVNTQWVETVTNEIDQIPDCRALEALIKKVEEMIKAQLEALLQQMADLLELALPPTNLKKLIAWAKKHCGKYYEMYLKVVATYVELTKAYTALLQSIQDKLANLKCDIKMPSINDIIPSMPDNELFTTVNAVYSGINELKGDVTNKQYVQGLLNVENVVNKIDDATSSGAQADGYVASKPTLDRPNP